MSALVPAAMTAGSALVSHFANKGNKSPLTTNQAGSVTDAMTSARTAGAQGASAFATGAPLLSQAASYYQRLTGGDVKAQQAAVAPQRQSILENYRGAERGLDAGALRGGARDYARADLARQKAGQIGQLVPEAIQSAVPQAAGLGTTLTGQAQSGNAQAGSIYTALSGQGENARQYDDEASGKLGGNIAGFLTNLLSTYYAGKSPKSTQTYAIPTVASEGTGGSRQWMTAR